MLKVVDVAREFAFKMIFGYSKRFFVFGTDKVLNGFCLCEIDLAVEKGPE